MVEFGEIATDGFWYRFEGEHLHSERTAYQQIDVYQTKSFGRVLVLDGLLQTTEEDEFCYHEMLVHVPMLAHPAPRRVLIIGGGDGGSLRHVLMHPTVERAVMCEIDQRVVEICRTWLPSISRSAFDDPRAELVIADGIRYVADSEERWDVVIVDSSDPIGPGVDLFRAPFYRSVFEHLSDDGLLCVQACSPFFQPMELHTAVRNMKQSFPDVRVYLGCVPTYPGTLWAYAIAGRKVEVDSRSAAARARERGIETRYWTPELHSAAFVLPRFVQAILEGSYPSFLSEPFVPDL